MTEAQSQTKQQCPPWLTQDEQCVWNTAKGGSRVINAQCAKNLTQEFALLTAIVVGCGFCGGSLLPAYLLTKYKNYQSG